MNVTLDVATDMLVKIDKKLKDFAEIEESCPFALDIDESYLSDKGKELLEKHRELIAHRVALQNRSNFFTAIIAEYFSGT